MINPAHDKHAQCHAYNYLPMHLHFGGIREKRTTRPAPYVFMKPLLMVPPPSGYRKAAALHFAEVKHKRKLYREE